MLNDSAMPIKVKRSSLGQEEIRRLRNTSREMPRKVKAHILSEFSHKLMLSGYDKKLRLDIIQSALTETMSEVPCVQTQVIPAG